jgi:hypothetical protein
MVAMIATERHLRSKLASGSTCYARFIRGTEHGDARFATASLSDQHVDACKKTSGCRVAHLSHGTYSYVPSVRVLSVRSAWTAQRCSKSEKRVSGTCGRRWASGPAEAPTSQRLGPRKRIPASRPITLIRVCPRGAAGERSVTLGAGKKLFCAWYTSRHFQSLLLLHEQTFLRGSSMSEMCRQVRTSAAVSFDDFVGACHQCRRSGPHCHSRQDDRFSDEVALQPVIDCEKHCVCQPVLRRKV